MDKWVESYADEAKRALELGHVRSIDFADSTYQVEIFDPDENQTFWPFLQFNEQQGLKDAFCSCLSEEEHCKHIATAYLKIFDASTQPLHVRFENSMINQLCMIAADHSRYDEKSLQQKAPGEYVYQNEIYFEIKTHTKDAKQKLLNLIENRPKETPETSIKFSNLSSKEISRWKEGRPGPSLRYILSFWFDLAKWMMLSASVPTVQFKEDDEGLPTHFVADFADFSIICTLSQGDLIKLIPFFNTINSPLKVFKASEEKIDQISFDPQKKQFLIKHIKQKAEVPIIEARQLGEWSYLSNKGFYPTSSASMLELETIHEKQISQFLEDYGTQISQFIDVHHDPLPLSYEVEFDQKWNWHFRAYLFEKGDLLAPDAAFFKSWVFLPGKGFYAVKEVLFNAVKKTIPASEVSSFVNVHRIWLGGKEGFQTHLASIESHLSYRLSKAKTLLFQAKARVESADSMDFGDWIYYKGQGFFSKKHARLGLAVRPGLEVPSERISAFITSNQEELESIPRFFSPILPIRSRGLEITIKSSSSLEVKPVYKIKPEFEEVEIDLFGDFAFIKEHGFCELPGSMRLPDAYSKPLIIGPHRLVEFLETELPSLKKYILSIDPKLNRPHRSDVKVEYLVRTGEGKLKARFFYQTEFGRVPVTDLLGALEHKRRFYFSDAGMIDLQEEQYQWMHGFNHPIDKDAQTLEFSTWEFIKLDATFGILGPQESTPTAQITRTLLKELRDFSTIEPPNPKGLKSILRLYQETGLKWLWFLYKNGLSGLLCDDMGLGKTHQAMALIAATLNQNPLEKKRYLVVCPTSVIYHWQDKINTFLPSLKVHTFYGLKRSLKRLPKEGVVLTTYGILRMEKQNLEKIPFEVAIFDEIQVAKNAHSRVHDALTHVRARMCIGLTGTPIENNLKELKALFDLVLPGYLPSETRFRELFVNPIERDLDEEKKALLIQMIRPFTLRRKKTEVLQELPEKSEDKSFCELSQEQSKLYSETLDQFRGQLISDLRDQEAKVNYVHIFSLLSKLKQICDHPALVHKDPKNYTSYSSGKWDLFVELLDEAMQSSQKVVVFSQYLYMLDIIENYLKESGREYAQIRGDTLNRREELKRFQEDPNCTVFIGSLQAAGLGIDLTAASVVIMYDRWWNAARENQAIDRVHRMGQKWAVQVYKLITKNTIEEKIDRMILRKGRLLEEVVKADDQAVFKKFTRSELIDLLSYSESS